MVSFVSLKQESGPHLGSLIAGLYHIDVVDHASDYEQRLLPLQWAIDEVRKLKNAQLTIIFKRMNQAIVFLLTGQDTPAPLEWPFTQETNEEQDTMIRTSAYSVASFVLPLIHSTRFHQRTSHSSGPSIASYPYILVRHPLTSSSTVLFAM